jgi:hypothetical protein
MVATYPYHRANEVGYQVGDPLPSADANIIDANAAAGADGSLWTDIAIAKNWPFTATMSGYGYGVVYNSVLKYWFTFGDTPVGKYSNPNLQTFNSLTIGAGDGLTSIVSAVSTSGVTVIGGTPGGSSNKKYRESSNGTTWNIRTSPATSTSGVKALKYFANASLFISGLNNAATTNIETSPDGQTWTQQTAPNSAARGAVIVGPTVAVVLSSSSSNKCLSTANGTSYTERTLPSTEIWIGGHYDTVYSRFVIYGATNLAYSTDGATWTSGGAHGLASDPPAFVAGNGRVLLTGSATGVIRVAHFIDTTFTSQHVRTLAGGSVSAAYGDGRFLVADDTGVHNWTIAGGGI